MKSMLVGTLLMAVALSTLGCKSIDVADLSPSALLPFGQVDEEEKDFDAFTPDSMATIWVDSVLTQAGDDPVRGFVGHIFFYDEEHNAVRVDGELVVFGFDDTKEEFATKEPDVKFEFAAEELQDHFKDSEFGPSYYFWVPWDKVGGFRKTVSLYPMLKTVDGKLVRGEQSNNVLPGKVQKQESETSSSFGRSRNQYVGASANQQGGFEGYPLSNNAGLGNASALSTTTIELPRAMAIGMSQPSNREQQAVRMTGISQVTRDRQTALQEMFQRRQSGAAASMAKFKPPSASQRF